MIGAMSLANVTVPAGRLAPRGPCGIASGLCLPAHHMAARKRVASNPNATATAFLAETGRRRFDVVSWWFDNGALSHSGSGGSTRSVIPIRQPTESSRHRLLPPSFMRFAKKTRGRRRPRVLLSSEAVTARFATDRTSSARSLRSLRMGLAGFQAPRSSRQDCP